MMKFETPYGFGTRVHIDADRDLVGVVTGFRWLDGEGIAIEVSWIHQGDAKVYWLQPWRLQKIEI